MVEHYILPKNADRTAAVKAQIKNAGETDVRDLPDKIHSAWKQIARIPDPKQPPDSKGDSCSLFRIWIANP
jgi:hypothetical protein